MDRFYLKIGSKIEDNMKIRWEIRNVDMKNGEKPLFKNKDLSWILLSWVFGIVPERME
ncbi:hypothetical protein IC006_2111 [Sulfuracidifex tepidarius]|uniref:Uncharacterized protein n=1 Tax=Sulfuracidifex tepidarius TaxID=1294262 RepID=A0A510DX46_9CREN|nr:hypothetical protein IC006_2111 [Sulfuracidifex tepidarius]BBG27563.1 hypothetical protein IC007_2117 [Sulfuracidifex tepidarius]